LSIPVKYILGWDYYNTLGTGGMMYRVNIIYSDDTENNVYTEDITVTGECIMMEDVLGCDEERPAYTTNKILPLRSVYEVNYVELTAGEELEVLNDGRK